MGATLTREDVSKLAQLTHLELDEAELDSMTGQLAEFLAYAQQVDEVPTEGVPPTTHVLTPRGRLRSDVPHESLPNADALRNAPDADRSAGLFKVPRVL